MIIHDIEQRTPEWYALRAGLPTASAFDCLVTPTGKLSTQIHDYASTLANEVFLNESDPDGFEGNAWTDRGEALEEQAIAWYGFMKDAAVNRVGFVTEKGKGWEAGCSPDGVIGNDGMLEIKALKAVNHTAALRTIQETGEPPKKYNAQTQGQMMIMGRKWCDLLFFHDRLPPIIIRQTPSEKLTESIRQQLVAVCDERELALKALQRQAGQLDQQEKSA